MKFINSASKYIFVIFFCEVLSIDQEKDSFIKDNENLLESNINTNDRSQSIINPNQKLENSLDDTVTSSKKRGSKILELKQVKSSFKITKRF